MKLVLFSLTMIFGLAYLTTNFGNFGSERRGPSSLPQHITNDSALYQNLSEIQVSKEKRPDFDRDLQGLSNLEHRYSERRAPRRAATQQAGRVAPKLKARTAQATRVRAEAKPEPRVRAIPTRVVRH